MTDNEIKDSGNEWMFIYQPLIWYFIAYVVKKACGRDYVRLIQFVGISGFSQAKIGSKQLLHHAIKKQLRSWDRTLYTDLALLHSMFVNLMKDPEDARVAEGIWRPNHLLTDFRRILQRYNDLQRSEIPFTPFTIKQETISIEKESNSNTEVIQLDDENESEVDNSNSLNNEVGNSDILNDEVEQPTSTVSSESNEVPSTSTNSTTIQKRQNWKQKVIMTSSF
ncbi:hypothetical protein M3Y97_00938500 [Aphelenchoides bicaudatus]|nr:hypothetical protein M3Y97_00938500 [Aphelenchoides bicaudatus]